jgi:hypothetical protein
VASSTAMNANGTLPPPLPNPLTVLAFLPPTLASQYQASIYVFVASVSVSIHYFIHDLYNSD